MPMSQGDVRDLLSAGIVDDPLYTGSRSGVFNTDCDPGDEDRSPAMPANITNWNTLPQLMLRHGSRHVPHGTAGDEDRSPVSSLHARIASLETEAAFWRANYENMKRMRDALLAPEDRPAPSPFTNALQHGWAAARYPTERT